MKRENVELTSDFTATINADLKVGALEETITVSAESPVVDTQSITTRTVMTREVMDAIPTGRNIQAVGIMIPGTAIAVGGGGALSRDVGGSGNLQQSPLQYRGSADTVQTIEGLRLNNLCAQGAYSGVYWNDGSFQEFSYVTGADSAEMGQGGMRVNMVPQGRRQLASTASCSATTRRRRGRSDNCDSPGVGQACTSSQPDRRHDLQQDEQLPHQRQQADEELRLQPRRRRADQEGQGLVLRDVPLPRRQQDGRRQLLRLRIRRRSGIAADTSRPGIDDGHIRSIAGRVSAQLSSKDKVSYYHDEQDKVRGHWGIASTVPPEAVGDSGDADQLRVGVEVDADAHQQAAVRRRPRGLQPGVPGELPAGSAGRQRRRS